MKHTDNEKAPMPGAIVSQLNELARERMRLLKRVSQIDAAVTAIYKLEAKEGRGPYA